MKTKTRIVKPGLFIISFLAYIQLTGQVCTPNPAYTDPGIWPDTVTNMMPACIGSPYQQDFTINVPADTVVSGFLFIIDSVSMDGITGLPTGFSTDCSPSSCWYMGNSSGCFIVTGNPTVPLTGSYPLTINTTVYAHNAVLGNQALPQGYDGYVLNIGSPPNIGTNSTSASCGLSDGSAWVVVSGSSPFTYLWNTSDSTDTISNIPAGIYDVMVTDNIGCTGTASVNVTNPGAPNIDSTNTTNPNCFGDTDGTAQVFASGGTPTYTYLWSSGGTGATETGLAAGSYTVNITDAANCQAQTSVTITTPSAIGTLISVTPETCIGCSDGTATVSASGGTPGYSYSWAPSGGSNSTATGLAAGTYTVTVTDSIGCSANNIANVYSTASIENDESENWKLYPNPVNETLFINCPFNGDMLKVDVYDMSGRKVLTSKFTSNQHQMNLSELNSGVYIVKLSNGKFSRSFKLLKK